MERRDKDWSPNKHHLLQDLEVIEGGAGRGEGVEKRASGEGGNWGKKDRAWAPNRHQLLQNFEVGWWRGLGSRRKEGAEKRIFFSFFGGGNWKEETKDSVPNRHHLLQDLEVGLLRERDLEEGLV